jgi:hypothetical protein
MIQLKVFSPVVRTVIGGFRASLQKTDSEPEPYPSSFQDITARPPAAIGDEIASCAFASHPAWSGAMQRRSFKQTLTFPEGLDEEAERLRTEADKLPPGIEREELLRKARQAETAAHVNEWLSSPGLQPPK